MSQKLVYVYTKLFRVFNITFFDTNLMYYLSNKWSTQINKLLQFTHVETITISWYIHTYYRSIESLLIVIINSTNLK